MERYNYEQDESYIKRLGEYIKKLEGENRKLKDKIEIFEKTKFEVMAHIDMYHPKTYMEAEKLQKIKEMFEKMYNEKLYLMEQKNKELEKENKLLKECNIRNYTSRSNTDDMNLKLLEENKRLKESLDIATKCSCKEEDGIIRLSEENKMLKEKLSEVTMIADDEKQSIEHILELEEENRNLTKCNLNLQEHIDKVEEENKRLKEVYDACNLDSINKTFKVANLKMENKKLKKELERYKKQYKHTMGEN